ncbi:proline racemase family protein [Streptomyces arenae]|uniref:proline racemase family protein n=1 Tax=Streptomyces arenae TaxID=29301 RepID=UPI00265B6DEC|nr:proline racemase family protein [Streptomyces arenae]MCG7207446.1 proline racemase family protein [Streptomyces arenae]
MRSTHVYHAVDSHTEGMPTRVVTGGVGTLPGSTMFERRQRFVADQDHVRTLLMCEPRGHASMSGAILQPPTRPDAEYGVLYIEVTGCAPMCGHGTMGVATVLVETGMVEVTEPETVVRLDTPAGLVTARVEVRNGEARSVTLENVASYLHGADQTVDVPGFGIVTYDIAYGGNFYAIVDSDELGLEFSRSNKAALLDAGMALMTAINAQNPVAHPENPEINICDHVYIAAPGSDAVHSRHAMVISPGYFDRSPCGTGTSARMAQLHARGSLALDSEFVNESFIGTRFTGRLIKETKVGDRNGVVPTITGRAWITGTAQYFVDPTDPFPAGFSL